MRVPAALGVGAIMLSAVAVLPPAAQAGTERDSRIYGGSATPGNPGVVALAINRGGAWVALCSAALWRPRLLLTAAHCVTNPGSGTLADGLAVFPPGAPAQVYSNTGPQGASPVRVVRWTVPDGYVNGNGRVSPHDIAVVELESDLGVPAFSRLASRFELGAWTSAQAAVDHAGYGLIGPGLTSQLPHSVSLPLLSYSPGSTLGDTFATAQDETKGMCPGDSGGPVVRTTGEGRYLIGVEVGSNSPCQSPPSPTIFNVGTAASGYLAFLNSALVGVGYAAIPGAPGQVTASGANRDVTVQWQAPALSPETVTGYDVLDESGAVVCQAQTTSCVIPAVADGQHGYAVRSRNVDGEGDADPIAAGAAVVIAPPPQMAAPRAVVSKEGVVTARFPGLSGSTTAIVDRYLVTDGKGTVLCRVLPDERRMRSCRFAPGPGTYRLRVVAQTGLGRSPVSPPSVRVRVRG
ncbi:MAG: trypsin-like serine protease [Candidatus Nanopelagicales bacterium]